MAIYPPGLFAHSCHEEKVQWRRHFDFHSKLTLAQLHSPLNTAGSLIYFSLISNRDMIQKYLTGLNNYFISGILACLDINIVIFYNILVCFSQHFLALLKSSWEIKQILLILGPDLVSYIFASFVFFPVFLSSHFSCEHDAVKHSYISKMFQEHYFCTVTEEPS